jgi:prepilin-type N-terminal cleavage/methylation domain-containing protein/prepilin-type processing-associated H-X9-DG protein
MKTCIRETIQQPTSRRNKAFTLIELLVVVAILSSLAAILFPVFARARENARRASCLSNLKQIALGSMQYVQDNDGHYPPSFPRSCDDPDSTCPILDADVSKLSGMYRVVIGSTNHYQTWMDVIYPYVKSTQVFICPSATADKTATSYGYNIAISGYSDYYIRFSSASGSKYTPITESAIVRPSRVIIFMDNNSIYNLTSAPWNMHGAPISVAPHLEGGNAAYVDGHVKWRPKAVLAAVPANDGNNCNPAAPVWTKPECNASWNPYLSIDPPTSVGWGG